MKTTNTAAMRRGRLVKRFTIARLLGKQEDYRTIAVS
jgi:hypothetical protein